MSLVRRGEGTCPPRYVLCSTRAAPDTRSRARTSACICEDSGYGNRLCWQRNFSVACGRFCRGAAEQVQEPHVTFMALCALVYFTLRSMAVRSCTR